MKWLLALVFTCSSLYASHGQERPRLWWVFLQSGTVATPKDKEAVTKMQTAHLDNFKRLFKEGKLLTAGPLADPEGKKRGILVLKASSETEIRGFFEADPYVKRGHMKAIVIPAVARVGVNSTAIDENQIEECRIVIMRLSKPSNAKDEKVRGDQHIKELLREFGGAWYQLENNGISQILLIPTKDTEALKERMNSHPTVAGAGLKTEVWPLWLAKGTLPAKM